MDRADPNLQALHLVSEGLAPRLEEFLFVGGATVGLLLTDPAARKPRPSKDVDVSVQVASRAAYFHDLRPFLLERGFVEDSREEAPVCRWLLGETQVDVMPDREEVFGFSNRWFPEAFVHAIAGDMGGRTIRHIDAPHFLATKFEAFSYRGGGDYYGSDDLEDVLAVVDGRPELLGEVRATPTLARSFIQTQVRLLLASPEFRNALPGHVDRGRDPIVLARLELLARFD